MAFNDYPITQNNLSLVVSVSDTPDTINVPVNLGVFYHGIQNKKLYLTTVVEGPPDHLQYTVVSEIDEGDALLPTAASHDRFTLYHPTGTNKLYINDRVNGWTNIAGPNPFGFNDVIYYVNHSSGSDTIGTGSSAAPFQTLAFAYNQIPKSPAGITQIWLIGEGPYILPTEMQGVTPQGELGQPLLIIGDTPTTLRATIVQSATDGVVTVSGGGLVANEYRGLLYECVSGSVVGRVFQIASNTTTTITLIGNTFTGAPGDVFNITQPTTDIISDTPVISGPGKIGFWRCYFVIATGMSVVDHASVLFDACTFEVANSLTADLQSICQFMATSESADFKVITTAGTQGGVTGAFFVVDKAAGAITFLDGSSGLGYLVSNGGLSAFRGSQVYLKGIDFDLSGSVAGVALNAAQQSSIVVNTGLCNIVANDSSGIGLSVTTNSYGSISLAGASITHAGLGAVVVGLGGEVDLGFVSGTTGNGAGVLVQAGGMLVNNGGNTLTGTAGDVLVSPSGTPIAWASVPRVTFAGSSSPVTTVLTDPSFYVNPSTGSDSNAGTITAPFATLNHALQSLTPGWYGAAAINLRAGTYTIAGNTTIPAPLGNNTTTAGGLLINGVDNTDSGLGTRTATGGSVGSFATFGTVIVAGGGFTVNAYRGSFIRFTSGSALGRCFLIEKNSATTFTVEGALPVDPTGSTFVVETPAAILSWAGQILNASGGVVGLQNVALQGGGGINALHLEQVTLGVQKCTTSNIGAFGIIVQDQSTLTNLSTIAQSLGLGSVSQCGVYFNNQPISMVSGGRINLSKCLFRDSNIEAKQLSWVQVIDSTFTGVAGVRLLHGSSLALYNFHFDTVTPVAADPDVLGGAGAAIVLAIGSSASILYGDISNTPSTTSPGDAILVQDGSRAQLIAITGTGNAGVGGRVVRSSSITTDSAPTTVTGTLGNMKCGAAAIAAWPASATVVNAAELCLIVGT